MPHLIRSRRVINSWSEAKLLCERGGMILPPTPTTSDQSLIQFIQQCLDIQTTDDIWLNGRCSWKTTQDGTGKIERNFV